MDSCRLVKLIVKVRTCIGDFPGGMVGMLISRPNPTYSTDQVIIYDDYRRTTRHPRERLSSVTIKNLAIEFEKMHADVPVARQPIRSAPIQAIDGHVTMEHNFTGILSACENHSYFQLSGELSAVLVTTEASHPERTAQSPLLERAVQSHHQEQAAQSKFLVLTFSLVLTFRYLLVMFAAVTSWMYSPTRGPDFAYIHLYIWSTACKGLWVARMCTMV